MKLHNTKKKSLKGMTLTEIIISIAVVAIMTVVLVGTASLIDQYIRSANNVNHKVADQLPAAEMRDIGNAHQVNGTTLAGAEDNYPVKITFKYNNGSTKTVTMKGDLWESEDPTNVSSDDLGGGLNLKFVQDIQKSS